ncbi:nitrate ABC transporter substrate-binding protein [Psychrilyobacter piezotolerans]|nr:nitrate ABC transporter substrate-binding protein [Psychrilyobacter piezotolerans]RDE60312.1 nitrate ABC transporter substrate-binding protein [Psychrilyobacter sp. S5]REI40420.1 nitrate ABC transporter substrate-binding protein [Psychrilyobacter piezotolerans]
MVEAQAYMQTERLIALMMLAAVVGYTIDRGLLQINKHLTSWREI